MDRRLLLVCVCPFVLLLGAAVNVEAHCELEGFNLNSLKNATYWNLTVIKENENCIIPQGYSAENIIGCTVYFSICKPLPEGICSIHTNSSTCQVVTTNDNINHYFDIGSNNDTTPDHGLKPATDDEKVGFYDVRQGYIGISTYCDGKYKTYMIWSCEPDADWDPSSTDVTVFIQSLCTTHTSTSCSLAVLFSYSGACPLPHSSVSSINPSATSMAMITASAYQPSPTYSPTATPPPYTTNHGPFTSEIPDERQKINVGGLIAGVVIFAAVCALLVILVITAAWYICKCGGQYKVVQTSYDEL